MGTGLLLASLLQGAVSKSDNKVAAQTCAAHGMVVRELISPGKDPEADAVMCAVPGQWINHQYPLPSHGLGGFTVIVLVLVFAGGCAAMWWLLVALGAGFRAMRRSLSG
jgi:hypothetical protein